MKTRALDRIAILTMLALAGVVAPRAGAESAESIARKGNNLYKQGKFDEAAEAYRQALMRNPDNSVIKYNLGTALARTGNLADAQKALTESAETPGSPRRGDSYYNLGVAEADSTKKKPEDQTPQAPATGAPHGAPQPPAAGAPPAVAAPNPVEAAQQKVAMLEQSLDSFRKSILTNAQDDRHLQECKYNYETVLEMLKQARQQLEQEKQKQQQGGNQGNNKDGQGQQNGQDQKNKQNQQGQNQQKNGQQGQQQQQGQKPGDQKNGQQGNDSQDGKGQMSSEQIDAMALLNMLESEKPEQFKQLYRFRGDKDSQKHPTKDW